MRRTPLAKARATGAIMKNPKRFRDRREPPNSVPLGDPPLHLDPVEMSCWEAFKRELPWLCESDRALVEAASTLRARLWTGRLDIPGMSALRLHLSQMGATPADRTRIVMPDDGGEDPADEFLQ